MTVAALNQNQLKQFVAERREGDLHAIAVGFHVPEGWRGPEEVSLDGESFRVVRAGTVLEIREALETAEREGSKLVILTELEQKDLGLDVVGRLARSRLFPIDLWSSLCSLFKAKQAAANISEPAVAEALLEYAPPGGYPPVPAGTLDAGTIWKAICRHVFEMGEREPDLVSLLLWTATDMGPKRYRASSPELRQAFRRRISATLGDAGVPVLDVVEGGAARDALPLAMVCQVVFAEGVESPILSAAAGRMERYFANRSLPPELARVLARDASDALAQLDRDDDPRSAQAQVARADELLRELRCEEMAFLSSLTPKGYEQRLVRFGEAVSEAVAKPEDASVAKVQELAHAVTEHRLADFERNREQVARTQMAIRLIRCLARDRETSAAGLADMAKDYSRDGAFVDWAREAITRGEEVASLSEAYQQLDQAVAERRGDWNRSFAGALADWTQSGSTAGDVLPIEHVLDQVVAKIAEHKHPVLVVVLDAMSWAVCHELLRDLRQDYWFETTLDEALELPPPVVATIPSVTGCSRASLLSGKLTTGGSDVEKKNFAAHQALVAASDRKLPPVLFHKGELTVGSRGAVSDEVRKAILESKRRVVGVVINAIDDRLSGAEQIRDRWTIDRISPLGAVLKTARDAGRVVVLVSDHGHVWHRTAAIADSSDTCERWRNYEEPIQDGEAVISGERVSLGLAGRPQIVVPWAEEIRYGGHKSGYHGGASPQEMICPLVILVDKSSDFGGLHLVEFPTPDWWREAPSPAAPAPTELTEPIPTEVDTKYPLFAGTKPHTTVAETEAAWLDELIGSPVYREQKSMVRRHAPDDDVVHRCLAALDRAGGMMTPGAFAQAADVPATRLDGLVAKIQRILNIDGYEVLSLDRSQNRIELNINRLKRQFGLE